MPNVKVVAALPNQAPWFFIGKMGQHVADEIMNSLRQAADVTMRFEPRSFVQSEKEGRGN